MNKEPLTQNNLSPKTLEHTMLEINLENQKGLVIDSIVASNYLIEYVESRGGSLSLLEFFDEDIVSVLNQEGITFIIIHNYLIAQLESILRIKKMGIAVLLLKRTLVPPEQADEHERLCQQLSKSGVTIGKSSHRVTEIKRFLARIGSSTTA